MATYTWNGIGNWLDAVDWSAGTPPLATDSAIIAGGTASVTSATTIASLAIEPGGATLDIEGASGSFTVAGGLVNGGNLDVDTIFGGGGSSLSIGGALSNTGTLQIGSNSDNLSTSATVTAHGLINSGTIDIYGSTGSAQAVLDILAAAPTALSGTFKIYDNAQLEFASGSVRTISSGGSLLLSGAGAEVSAGGGNALTKLASNAGTLDLENRGSLSTTTGLANTGSLLFDIGSRYFFGPIGGSSLVVGGTLNNSGLVEVGNSFNLNVSTTLSAAGLFNTGTIEINGGGGSAEAVLDIAGAAPTMLTGTVQLYGNALLEFGSGGIRAVGPGAELALTGAGYSPAQPYVADSTDTSDNSALAGLTRNSGTLQFNNGITLSATAGMTNSGDLSIDAGYGRYSGGSDIAFAGTLANSGALYIGNSRIDSATTLGATALLNSGTIELYGNSSPNTAAAVLAIGGAAGFGAAGVVTGAVTLNGDSVIEFASGKITAIAAGAALYLGGSDAFVAAGGTTASNSALTGLANNSGSLQLESGAAVTTSGGLVNSGAISLDTQFGDGGSTLSLGGTLSNLGDIEVGTNFGGLTASSTVLAKALVNSGTVDLFGSSIPGGPQAALEIAGPAPATLTGIIKLSGNALLEFSSGGVAAIGAGSELRLLGSNPNSGAHPAVALNSNTASNSALVGLAANSGILELENGVVVATAGSFENSGSINLDTNFGAGGSTLSIAGNLDDLGTVTVGNSELARSALLIAGGLDETGTLTLQGGPTAAAMATIGGAATNSGTMTIGSFAELQVTGAGGFTQSSGKTTVTGILAAATIAVNGGLVEFTTPLAGGIGTGAIEIGGDGTVAFDASVAAGETVSFTGDAGTLRLAAAGQFAGSIGGFVAGDEIDLARAAVTGLGYSGTASGGTLSVLGSTGTIASLAILGDYTVSDFTFVSDGNGGTDIELVPQTSPLTFVWNGGSGTWTTGSGWSQNAVPGAGDDAIISAQGFYTISLTTAATVNAIEVTAAGATLAIAAPGQKVAVAAQLIDAGAVTVDAAGAGGTTLSVGGAITASGMLAIGNSALTASTTVSAKALFDTGQITIAGGTGSAGSILDIAAAAPTLLTGTVQLFDNALLEFASGSIAEIGGGAELSLTGGGAGSPAQPRVADAGSLAASTALAGLDDNAGILDLESGVSVATTGAFSNAGILMLDTGPGAGGSSLVVGSLLTNTGQITVGPSSGGLAASTTLAAHGLAGHGTTSAFGSTGAGQAAIDILAAAPSVLTGHVALYDNALLEFASGSIGKIGKSGELLLSGDGAGNSAQPHVADSGGLNSDGALAGLKSNAGTLAIQSGVTLALRQGLANSGRLEVDAQGTGGSTLTIAGLLTESGYSAYAMIGNAGLLASATVTASGFAGYGIVSITGGTAGAAAVLDITGAAPQVLNGYFYLTNNALLEFSSGSVTGIGERAGLTLQGAGAGSPAQPRVADSSNTASSSAFSGLASNAGYLSLRGGASVAIAGGLGNSGFLSLDTEGAGGSSLSVAGILTDTGFLEIGNRGLTASATVSAGGLVIGPRDTVEIFGGSSAGSGEGVLAVAAPAPSVITGNVELFGNALLQFASGSVTAIASGGQLLLQGGGPGSGAQPRVADAGNTGSDSALAQLSSNAGFLNLQSGASLALGGSLQNTDLLYVDETGSGGSSLSIAGTLASTDFVEIGPFGGSLAASSTLTAGGLLNSGTIEIEGGNGSAEAVLNVLAAAPGQLTGRFFLSDNALLEFASGSIVKIASNAELQLTGGGAGSTAQPLVADAGKTTSDSALSQLVTNFGTLDVESGTSLSLTGDFSNYGYLYIDEGFQTGGSRLDIAGTLFNIGTAEFGPFSVSLLAPTTVTVGGLDNLGFLSVEGGAATLDVNGGVANTGSIGIGRFAALTVGAGQNYVQTAGTTNDNGTLSAREIDIAGGTLIGAGTVTGNLDNTGGTVEAFNTGHNSPGQLTINGAYSQGPAGILQVSLAGTAPRQYSRIAVTGSVTLGGTLNFLLSGIGLAAGESFTIMTFTPGELQSLFGTVESGSRIGNATSVNLGNGFDIGIVYNYAAGNIVAQVLTAPTTTADSWTGGAGNWSTAADWTNGVPVPYSDVTIGAASGGNVTLDETDTVDSLTITAGNTLGFAAGEALTAGGSLSVQAGGSLAVTAAGDLLVIGGSGSDAGLMTLSAGASLFADGTLTIGGSLVLGGGTLGGSGTVSVAAGGLISGPGTLAGSLTNSGSVAGELTIAAGGYLLNSAGATITNTGTALLGSGGEIVNDGLISGNGASGVGVAFSGSGNILVDSGSIAGGGGTAVSFGAGSELLILYPGAGFTGQVAGGGSGNTIELAGTTAGSLSGLGSGIVGFQLVEVDPGAEWQLTGTNLVTAGVTLQDGGVLIDAGTLTNAGKITGTLTLSGGGTLHNGGLVADPDLAVYGIGGGSTITNSGTVKSNGDTGIWLSAGGLIINGSTAATNAMISGYFYGVREYGSSGTLANFGAITSVDGVAVESGGVVINGNSSSTLGVVSGYVTGVYLYGSGAKVANFATIEATGAIGIGLDFGGAAGQLTNNGLLEALGVAGVGIGGGKGAITNNGTVEALGNSGFGMSLSGANGRITNAAGGVIQGDVGLYLGGSGWTVSDYGNISSTAGTAGAAVEFAAGVNDLLVVGAGAVFTGAVEGGGQSGLSFLQPGTDSMSGFSGFSSITLANGGANNLALANANFNGVTGGAIAVFDGNAGNTVSGSGLLSSEAIVVHAGAGADILTGGAGNDFFYAGGDTTMTGKGGTNAFVFLASGANNIVADFTASASNELVFSNTGFNLGESGATSTPQLMADAGTLFVANSTGAFTNNSQRLAYDTTNGELFASANGSGSTPHLVATLTGAPSVLGSHLFFVS